MIVPRTHLAAIVIEHNTCLHSADNDFRHFPELKFHNSLGQTMRLRVALSQPALLRSAQKSGPGGAVALESWPRRVPTSQERS